MVYDVDMMLDKVMAMPTASGDMKSKK